MATYKTTSLIDFTKTVVVSFDTNHSPFDFDFGIGLFNHNDVICGRVDLKGHRNISFSDDYDVSGDEIEFSILTDNLFSDGYLLQKLHLKSEDVQSSNDFEFEKDRNGYLLINSTKVKEDSVLFKRISDYETIKENLIVENGEVYVESKTEEPIAFVFECEDDYILKLSSEDGLELLSLDYGLTKNLEEESLLLLSHGTKSINDSNLTISESIIRNSPFNNQQRIRFVISNNAKLMSISLYNNDKKIYEEYTSFTFNYAIEKGYLAIYIKNSSSVPSNVSTNF